MDKTTLCKKCGKRMVPVITIAGRTDLQCISCDDPAVRWAESPLTAPEHGLKLGPGGVEQITLYAIATSIGMVGGLFQSGPKFGANESGADFSLIFIAE